MDMNALKKYIEISPEVQDALDHNKPVIAMETTIVAQGFPYPENVKMAHRKFLRQYRYGAILPDYSAVLPFSAIYIPLSNLQYYCS